MEAKLKKFTSFDGTRLAYYDHSEQVCEKARSVVLLHGLMSSGLDMAKFGELLTKKNLRAFALDYRAHGLSEGPKDPEMYRNQAMARDVIALVKHLNLTEYGLMAVGLGCEFTARIINLGAQVRRAVMCGWGGSPTDQLNLYASSEWAAQAERLADGFEQENPDNLTDELAKRWRENADRKGLDRYALAARMRSGDSAEPGLDPRKISIPVLVICGVGDKSPHEFANALPNAKGLVVGGDHSSASQAPELGLSAAEFLSEPW